MENNQTLTTIFNRKSVRQFSDKQISDSTLELLVKAGMAAPSAVDKRPWSFVIIQDKEILQKISEALPNGKMLPKSAACIVVCSVPERMAEWMKFDYCVIDCSAATQNILIAAESLGLGAVWLGVYPNIERVDPLKKILGVPEKIIPLHAIALGYPAKEEKPKDKFNPENIHWEKW